MADILETVRRHHLRTGSGEKTVQKNENVEEVGRNTRRHQAMTILTTATLLKRRLSPKDRPQVGDTASRDASPIHLTYLMMAMADHRPNQNAGTAI
jgi:hypothetical protein